MRESDALPHSTRPDSTPPPIDEPQAPYLGAPWAEQNGADEEERRRQDALRRAFSSPILVGGGRTPGTRAEERPPVEPARRERELLEAIHGIRDLVPGAFPDALANRDPGLQEEKQEFLTAARRLERHPPPPLEPPLSPYEIKAGSVIPALLVTGANSDLPGHLVAQVRENVYDTATGAHLLIPQGTRLLGTYDSLVAFGQERLLVAWQRLLFPDGSSLELGGMPGTDAAGHVGFHDRVDHHLVRVFGSATLLSAISAGLQLSQTGSRARADDEGTDMGEVLSAALGQELGRVGTELLRRNLNVQPTLEIRPGYRFNVMVVRDLVLPRPYRDG